MNSLQQVLAFASAARHSSFAKAARELGQSPSTVAKSITRLEAQLRVKLFYRTTRQVSLTPDGQRLYAQCERILEEIEALKSLAAGVSGAPSGTLRVDMPLVYGKRVILPILSKLLAQHPQLTIDARLSDQYSDVIREGLDAVIRIGSLADSTLVAKPIGTQHLVVCASPAYLKKHGVPQTPYALEEHECVLFRVPTTGRDRPWHFRVDSVNAEIQPRARLRLGDGEALVEAARLGLGLIQVPDYMTTDGIKAGHIVEVLERYRPTPMPISIVYPATRMLPPRVRVLIEALTKLDKRKAGE